MELEDFLSDSLLEWCVAESAQENSELDSFFLSALDSFERDHATNSAQSYLSPRPPTSSTHASSRAAPTSARPYAAPKTDQEIADARVSGVPKKTQEDTQYCVRLWNEWCKYRQQNHGNSIPGLTKLQPKDLQHWLVRFILEVRKKDGSEFAPNSLHHVCCGIMRYLRWNGQPSIDFFADAAFAEFRASLDAEMKRLQAAGIGTNKKQAEPLTAEEEETLWQRGLLGDETPQTLLDTIIFMNGLYFALRSGKEHCQLRFTPSQIELVEKPGERPHLIYREDISKNRPGGLKGRKMKPKVVVHHANIENTKRCFVRLYKLYMSLCPADRPPDCFYLLPLQKPSATCWYSNRPLGYHKLGTTVACLCKSAGIKGHKTNHSLRVTAATRLYESGVDEQLVMETTGHCSTEGVRTYKRTSAMQREAVSDILSCAYKKPCIEQSLPAPESLSSELLPHSSETVPVQSAAQAVCKTASASASIPGSFYFQSCSSVTINLNCNSCN